jgi:hypothetical protein
VWRRPRKQGKEQGKLEQEEEEEEVFGTSKKIARSPEVEKNR